MTERDGPLVPATNMTEDFEGLFGVDTYELVIPKGGIPASEELEDSFVIPDEWFPEVKTAESTIPIRVNQERVDLVLGNLMEAYERREFPYDLPRVRLPHDPRHMPETLERGSKDHAMFFWNVCYYMRGGTKSTVAVRQMAKLYDERPELFDCEKIVQVDPADLSAELKSHGLGFQDKVAGHWIENAMRMLEQFDGDPRRIFENVDSYDVALGRIKNDNKGNGFLGFREKMASMITYYLMDDGLVKPFNFPIPVDLHVMRVSIENRLVEFPDVPFGTDVYSERLLATLRDVYFNYAEENGVDPLRLCDAVWLLSEALCGKTPGNITSEPFGRKMRDGRKTYLTPQIVDINNPRQIKDYELTCRDCPVNETCEYNVPGGATYYVAGAVLIRGERVEFPDNTLLGPNWIKNARPDA